MQTEKNKDVDVTAAFKSNGRVLGIIRKFTNNSVREVKAVVLVNRVQFATHASILIKEKPKLLQVSFVKNALHPETQTYYLYKSHYELGVKFNININGFN